MFKRHIGDIHLGHLTTRDVAGFLDSRTVAAATWRLKYFALRAFFEYWSLRGVISRLWMPVVKQHVPQTFVPHIYTRAQLRALSGAIPRCQRPPGCTMSRQTFRAFLVLLYGTGARVGEVLSLKENDFDFRTGLLTFRGEGRRRGRTIPVSFELQRIIDGYRHWRRVEQITGDSLLVNSSGRSIPFGTVRHTFLRLCGIAGVTRTDGSKRAPRMHDMRQTFAVHRITQWIHEGKDLNRLLPALAAYMGQAGLGATDVYLSLAPERFRSQLNKLSQNCATGHWRDDKVLITFLRTL